MTTLALDHVGVIVQSLDAGHEAFSRLGFQLTPRSVHSGSVNAGDPVIPWGSGNHCAMFEQGYLEIMGIYDPALYSNAGEMLDRYEGAHIIAIGWDDADAGYAALTDRCPGVSRPTALERDAPFGVDGSQTRRARFRNTRLDGEIYPEAHFIFIEHLTRDVLWQAHLLQHPNGALAIQETAIASAEPDATCARLARALDREPQDQGHGVRRFELAGGALLYVLPAALVPRWAKGVEPPAVPSVVGLGIRVRDLEATKMFLDEKGVPWNAHPYPAIWVEPAHACGTVVSFIQA